MIHKKVRDKHGNLYTLSLMDKDDKLLRRGPVYIHKPNYHRRLISQTFEMLLLIGLAVVSVSIVAVATTDLGNIAVIQESCKIASLEVIKTGDSLGFMRIVIQNDSDEDTTAVKLTDTQGTVEFFDSRGTLQTIHNFGSLPGRGTLNEGIRITSSPDSMPDSVLVQATVDYGGSIKPLTCTAEATVR